MKLLRFAALGILAGLVWPAASVAAQNGALSGRIFVAAGGSPIVAAEIQFPGLKLSTRSDSAGLYQFSTVPVGKHEVIVRSIGYEPLTTEIDFPAGKMVRAHFQMTSNRSVLDTVTVNGQLERRWADQLIEFDQRRRGSAGVFLTHDKIAKNSSMTVAAMLRSMVPGLRIAKLGGSDVAISSRGGRNCPLQVIMNRMNLYNGESFYFDVNSIEAAELIGVEFYNSFNTPSEMLGRPRGPYGGSRCGTLVVWMK